MGKFREACFGHLARRWISHGTDRGREAGSENLTLSGSDLRCAVLVLSFQSEFHLNTAELKSLSYIKKLLVYIYIPLFEVREVSDTEKQWFLAFHGRSSRFYTLGIALCSSFLATKRETC